MVVGGEEEAPSHERTQHKHEINMNFLVGFRVFPSVSECFRVLVILVSEPFRVFPSVSEFSIGFRVFPSVSDRFRVTEF